jgi:putative transposase
LRGLAAALDHDAIDPDILGTPSQGQGAAIGAQAPDGDAMSAGAEDYEPDGGIDRELDPSDPAMEPEVFDQSVARIRAASALLELEHCSRYHVMDAAAELGVSPSTVYRDMKRLRDGPLEVRALKRKAGYPGGRCRLHFRVVAITDQHLLKVHCSTAQPSVLASTAAIGDQCEAEGLGRPSRAAVIRRLARIDLRVQVLRRRGPRAAEAVTPRPGHHVVATPWGEWQIDHTLTDVIVVDVVHRLPIGRAWLTVVIDVCTRLVVGFYVSLEPPSLVRAAVALDLAVQDKTAWLIAMGVHGILVWPVSGLPRVVHSDRASEFRSRWFALALKNQLVDPVLRPPGKTRYGGHIERLIGTLMGKCKMLPGATHNSPAARGQYDSKASARLTVDELQAFFAEQILGVYHNTPHAGLDGRTPLEAWTAVAGDGVGRAPVDAEAFRFDLFPGVLRQIGRQGIQLCNEHYCSPQLMEAYLSGLRQVAVKYDPRDMSRIHIKVAKDRFITVPILRADGQTRPLWLYHASRRGAAATGQRWDRALVRQAQDRTEAMITQASAKSDRARRQADRLAAARRQPRGPAGSDLEHGLDDWGLGETELNRDEDW